MFSGDLCAKNNLINFYRSWEIFLRISLLKELREPKIEKKRVSFKKKLSFMHVGWVFIVFIKVSEK